MRQLTLDHAPGRSLGPVARAATLGLAGAAAAVLLTALALRQPLYAAALLYVAGFLVVTARQPAVALMLIFASAPFQNDLSGGGGAKFSIAEVNLVLTLAALYARCLTLRRLPRVGPILVPVLLYFSVCLCSSAIHWVSGEAVISLVQMFLYFVVAVAVFNEFALDPSQYWPSFYALVSVGVFLALAGLATDYWFIGLNKNGIAASLACSFLVGTELALTAETGRRRVVLLLALGIIALGLLFSLSRGAWLGTGSGVIFIFALRRRLPLLARIGAALLPLLALFWFTLPSASREYAIGFNMEDHYNIKLRYDSIMLTEQYFQESPIYGMGVGLRKDYDATNVLLMTLAETGVLGGVGFLLIHAAFFRMIAQARKRIAPTEALYSLLCIGGALVLDKFMHGLVDHYWSRGALMVAWAAAGMATRAYYIARSRAAWQGGDWRA